MQLQNSYVRNLSNVAHRGASGLDLVNRARRMHLQKVRIVRQILITMNHQII